MALCIAFGLRLSVADDGATTRPRGSIFGCFCLKSYGVGGCRITYRNSFYFCDNPAILNYMKLSYGLDFRWLGRNKADGLRAIWLLLPTG